MRLDNRTFHELFEQSFNAIQPFLSVFFQRLHIALMPESKPIMMMPSDRSKKSGVLTPYFTTCRTATITPKPAALMSALKAKDLQNELNNAFHNVHILHRFDDGRHGNWKLSRR